MNDELIRKSELLEKLNDSYELNWTNDDYVTGFNLGLKIAIDAVEELQPANAIELPCKIGNKLYEVCKQHYEIHEQTVEGISISKNAALINCESKNFYWCEIGKKVFLTREEAEKALENLKQYEETF